MTEDVAHKPYHHWPDECATFFGVGSGEHYESKALPKEKRVNLNSLVLVSDGTIDLPTGLSLRKTSNGWYRLVNEEENNVTPAPSKQPATLHLSNDNVHVLFFESNLDGSKWGYGWESEEKRWYERRLPDAGGPKYIYLGGFHKTPRMDNVHQPFHDWDEDTEQAIFDHIKKITQKGDVDLKSFTLRIDGSMRLQDGRVIEIQSDSRYLISDPQDHAYSELWEEGKSIKTWHGTIHCDADRTLDFHFIDDADWDSAWFYSYNQNEKSWYEQLVIC